MFDIISKGEGSGPNKEGARGVGVDFNCGIGSWMAGIEEQFSCMVINFS